MLDETHDDNITIVFTSNIFSKTSITVQELIDLAKQELNIPTYDNVSDDPNYQVSYIGDGPSSDDSDDGLKGDTQSTMSQFTNLNEDLPDDSKNETTSPMNTGGSYR